MAGYQDTRNGGAQVQVVVELVAARIVGEELRFTIQTAACPRTGDPDATARAELATLFPDLWLRQAIVHSTSWRYEDERIVLTYLGYSDEFEVAPLPLTIPLARASDITRGPAAVAAHAIRHLAFLVREARDGYGQLLRPDTCAALMQIAPDVSGRHDLKGAA